MLAICSYISALVVLLFQLLVKPMRAGNSCNRIRFVPVVSFLSDIRRIGIWSWTCERERTAAPEKIYGDMQKGSYASITI